VSGFYFRGTTWSPKHEASLRGMRREHRKLKVREAYLARLYRCALEQHGAGLLKEMDPELRRMLPAVEEGNPETRAMGRVVRCLEALKRELLRPGGPEDDALYLAKERLLKASEILEGFGDDPE